MSNDAVSEAPDFSTIDIKVDLGENGGVKTFKKHEELRGFLEEEGTFWTEFIEAGRKAKVNNKYLQPAELQNRKVQELVSFFHEKHKVWKTAGDSKTAGNYKTD